MNDVRLSEHVQLVLDFPRNGEHLPIVQKYWCLFHINCIALVHLATNALRFKITSRAFVSLGCIFEGRMFPYSMRLL